jgi:hypothetical protein
MAMSTFGVTLRLDNSDFVAKLGEVTKSLKSMDESLRSGTPHLRNFANAMAFLRSKMIGSSKDDRFVANMKSMATAMAKFSTESTTAFTGLDTTLSRVTASLGTMLSLVKQYNGEVRTLIRNIASLPKRLSGSFTLSRTRLGLLRDQARQTSEALGRVGTSLTAKDTRNASRAMSESLRHVSRAAREARDEVTGVGSSFEGALLASMVGYYHFNSAVSGVTQTIIGGVSAAIQKFAELEMTMARVKSLMGFSSNDSLNPDSLRQRFDGLRDRAEQINRETQFRRIDVFQAFEQLGRAGLRPQEAQLAIEPALNLSAASGGILGIAEAAELMALVKNTLQVPADQLGTVADMLVAAERTSNVRMDQMIQIFRSMRGAGMRFDVTPENSVDMLAQFMAISSALSLTGRSAAESGMDIQALARSISLTHRAFGRNQNLDEAMLELIAGPGEHREAVQEALRGPNGRPMSIAARGMGVRLQGLQTLGITPLDFINPETRSVRGPLEVLENIVSAIDRSGLDESVIMTQLSSAFGSSQMEGMIRAVRQLRIEGRGSVSDLYAEFKNVGDLAEDARKLMADTITGQYEILMSIVEAIQTAFVEPFGDNLKSFLETGVEVARWIEDQIKSFPQLRLAVTSVGGALLATSALLTVMTGAMLTMILTLSVVRPVMASFGTETLMMGSVFREFARTAVLPLTRMLGSFVLGIAGAAASLAFLGAAFVYALGGREAAWEKLTDVVTSFFEVLRLSRAIVTDSLPIEEFLELSDVGRQMALWVIILRDNFSELSKGFLSVVIPTFKMFVAGLGEGMKVLFFFARMAYRATTAFLQWTGATRAGASTAERFGQILGIAVSIFVAYRIALWALWAAKIAYTAALWGVVAATTAANLVNRGAILWIHLMAAVINGTLIPSLIAAARSTWALMFVSASYLRSIALFDRVVVLFYALRRAVVALKFATIATYRALIPFTAAILGVASAVVFLAAVWTMWTSAYGEGMTPGLAKDSKTMHDFTVGFVFMVGVIVAGAAAIAGSVAAVAGLTVLMFASLGWAALVVYRNWEDLKQLPQDLVHLFGTLGQEWFGVGYGWGASLMHGILWGLKQVARAVPGLGSILAVMDLVTLGRGAASGVASGVQGSAEFLSWLTTEDAATRIAGMGEASIGAVAGSIERPISAVNTTLESAVSATAGQAIERYAAGYGVYGAPPRAVSDVPSAGTVSAPFQVVRPDVESSEWSRRSDELRRERPPVIVNVNMGRLEVQSLMGDPDKISNTVVVSLLGKMLPAIEQQLRATMESN